MEDIEGAVKTLRQLRKRGIMLSIANLDAGFSSLDYLRRMPIKALKIDRSFVKKIPPIATT